MGAMTCRWETDEVSKIYKILGGVRGEGTACGVAWAA